MIEPPDPLEATAAEPPRPAAPGAGAARPPVQTIGKYRLSRILGSGGMGVVWAAIDPDLERDVAIKLLHGASNEPTLRSRLLREARAMAKLKHPNVLTVYEVGTDDNRDFIAMELVDGDSLEGWLATKPPRAEILAALLAAGRGLVAAHVAGIVHRDFKPHNVLRSRDGHVYVTDFGLARGQLEEGVDIEQLPLATLIGTATATAATPTPIAVGSQPRRALDSVLDAPLTQTGVLIGTPAYMAPEQFAGRIPDPRSDQFAFCVTAWEALAGTRPFRGSTLAELEVASGGGAPTKMPSAELPPAIRAVLARGLDPEPSKRWPDMAALLDALARVTAPPKRMALMAALGAFAVTAIAIGAIVILTRDGNGRDRERAPRPVVVAAKSDPCADPGAAFAKSWSPAHRDALAAAHAGGATIGAIAILDDVRRQWIASYEAGCAVSPRTDEIRERFACLDALRDRIASTTARMTRPNTPLEMPALGALAAGVMICDPSARPFGLDLGPGPDVDVDVDVDDELRDEREVERALEDAARRRNPVSPLPPVPPVPPATPPTAKPPR